MKLCFFGYLMLIVKAIFEPCLTKARQIDKFGGSQYYILLNSEDFSSRHKYNNINYAVV